MGLAQLSSGSALLLMPVIAAGLLAAIGLTGILILDVVSYAFAVLGAAAGAVPRPAGLAAAGAGR